MFNIKKIRFYLIALYIMLLCSCGRKNNLSVAKNYYNLSLLELEGGQGSALELRAALEHINAALKNDKKPEYFALAATLLFKLNKKKDAARQFKKALSCAADQKMRSEILNNYACLLADMGKDREAVKIWSGLETSANYMTPEVASFNLSKLFVARKKYSKAKARLNKAIELAPSYVDAHFYLAVLFFTHLNKKASAKKEVETALLLEPEHLGAKRLLSLIKSTKH